MILITLPDVVVAVVVAVVVIDGIRPTTVCLPSFKVIFFTAVASAVVVFVRFWRQSVVGVGVGVGVGNVGVGNVGVGIGAIGRRMTNQSFSVEPMTQTKNSAGLKKPLARCREETSSLSPSLRLSSLSLSPLSLPSLPLTLSLSIFLPLSFSFSLPLIFFTFSLFFSHDPFLSLLISFFAGLFVAIYLQQALSHYFFSFPPSLPLSLSLFQKSLTLSLSAIKHYR